MFTLFSVPPGLGVAVTTGSTPSSTVPPRSWRAAARSRGIHRRLICGGRRTRCRRLTSADLAAQRSFSPPRPAAHRFGITTTTTKLSRGSDRELFRRRHHCCPRPTIPPEDDASGSPCSAMTSASARGRSTGDRQAFRVNGQTRIVGRVAAIRRALRSDGACTWIPLRGSVAGHVKALADGRPVNTGARWWSAGWPAASPQHRPRAGHLARVPIATSCPINSSVPGRP